MCVKSNELVSNQKEMYINLVDLVWKKQSYLKTSSTYPAIVSFSNTFFQLYIT